MYNTAESITGRTVLLIESNSSENAVIHYFLFVFHQKKNVFRKNIFFLDIQRMALIIIIFFS